MVTFQDRICVTYFYYINQQSFMVLLVCGAVYWDYFWLTWFFWCIQIYFGTAKGPCKPHRAIFWRFKHYKWSIINIQHICGLLYVHLLYSFLFWNQLFWLTMTNGKTTIFDEPYNHLYATRQQVTLINWRFWTRYLLFMSFSLCCHI